MREPAQNLATAGILLVADEVQSAWGHRQWWGD